MLNHWKISSSNSKYNADTYRNAVFVFCNIRLKASLLSWSKKTFEN